MTASNENVTLQEIIERQERVLRTIATIREQSERDMEQHRREHLETMERLRTPIAEWPDLPTLAIER